MRINYGKFSEGILICIGLTVVGLVLQFTVGSVDWNNLAWPVNLIILLTYILLLFILYLYRKRFHLVGRALHYTTVVPALASVVIMTLVMGLVKQAPAHSGSTDLLGLSKMTSFWPFVLIYGWNVTILGWAIIKHLCTFKWRKIPFLCNHLGLFIALTCAVLGSADMQRLTMFLHVGDTQWRGIDAEGRLKELPLAIELKNFTINEYPPQLQLINNETGKALPEENPEHLTLGKDFTHGNLSGWDIRSLKRIENAVPKISRDTIDYIESEETGATFAAFIKATSADGKQVRQGWVSCGSFLFPYQDLYLDTLQTLIMPDREPKRFVSEVIIYTQDGQKTGIAIEVNKPAKIEGWTIYQSGYDETKGKWSDFSIFELVSDPWLPAVYTGIGMMILGAIFTFVIPRKNKEENQ